VEIKWYTSVLSYADRVNLLGESIHIIKKKKTLLVDSEELVREVNAQKPMYMFVYCEHNAEQNHNIKIRNKSYECVEQFKYLEQP
jgi:hypothetical protein